MWDWVSGGPPAHELGKGGQCSPSSVGAGVRGSMLHSALLTVGSGVQDASSYPVHSASDPAPCPTCSCALLWDPCINSPLPHLRQLHLTKGMRRCRNGSCAQR